MIRLNGWDVYAPVSTASSAAPDVVDDADGDVVTPREVPQSLKALQRLSK